MAAISACATEGVDGENGLEKEVEEEGEEEEEEDEDDAMLVVVEEAGLPRALCVLVRTSADADMPSTVDIFDRAATSFPLPEAPRSARRSPAPTPTPGPEMRSRRDSDAMFAKSALSSLSSSSSS